MGRMNSDMTLTIQGRRLRLAASHSLEGTSPASLASAFADLTPPCTISLSSEVSCGDDHVVAVNLTRPMDPPNPMLVEDGVQGVQEVQRCCSCGHSTHEWWPLRQH